MRMKILTNSLIAASVIAMGIGGYAVTRPEFAAQAYAATAVSAATAPANSASPDAPNFALYVSARRTIGLPVSDITGRRVGKLRDFLIYLDTTTVRYAEVAMEEGRVGWVPLNELRSRAQKAGFIVNMTVGRLKEVLDASFALPGRSPTRASELLGSRVADVNGKHVGQLEDVVVNMPNGIVTYTVVRFEPNVLARNELLTFQLDQISGRPNAHGRQHLTLAIDAAELKTRNGYTRGEWDGVHDPAHWLGRHASPRP